MVVDYDGSQDLDTTVVRFTAEWCGPCKAFAPVFNKIAEQNDETYVVVDVDEYPEVAQEYRVMSIPAVFDHGQRVMDYTNWARTELS